MKTFLLGFITLLLCVSCVGIESEVRFNSNLSGTLTLTYRISQLVKDLDTTNESKMILPLPVSEQEFKRTAEAIEGLKLVSVTQKEDEENITIQAKMEFSRIEALQQIGNGSPLDVTLRVQVGTTTFRQVLATAQETRDISPESMAMIETLFKGYELSFLIEAPNPIKSHSLGELSQDKKKLTYHVSILDLFKSPGDRVLEAKW